MADDERDTLEVLKAELAFLEKGGYGRSVRTPWKGESIFLDSLSCINFAEPEKVHPCDECLLMDFVPSEDQSCFNPCHAIPLNESGDTIESMEGRSQDEIEGAVKGWLRATISRLEREKEDN